MAKEAEENTDKIREEFQFVMKVRQEEIQRSNERPKFEPQMKIADFSPDGKITFVFDQQMLIPNSFRNFTFTTNTIIPQTEPRDLKEAQGFALISNFLDFSLERGSSDSAPVEDLAFTVELIEYSTKTLVLQLLFDKPLSVSIGSFADELKIKIIDPAIFVSQESGKTLDWNKVYRTPIPRLFTDE